MAIDIYNSRRVNYHKCNFWYRNENVLDDDNILTHDIKPDGVFFAKELDTISKDTRDANGMWQYQYTRLKLETSDKVGKLKANDYVKFEDKFYLVEGVEIKHIHKRQQFNEDGSVITYIYLRGE